MEFNKTAFSHLLRLALGSRSINKYGKDAGVDPGYISRYLRLQIDNPPSATVISKLADGSQGRVTAEMMMEVAGYLQIEHDEPESWLKEVAEAPAEKQKALKEIWEIIRKM